MEIEERIRRRQRRDGTAQFVNDIAALSPTTHVSEPTGRGRLLEQVLDCLDPVFDEELPTNGYVWGPRGTGKTAILTSLCHHLSRLSVQANSIIHTSTRAKSPSTPEFVYLDTRHAASSFAIYQGLLNGIIEDSVPEHGVSTMAVRDQLMDELTNKSTVIAFFDHLNEPTTPHGTEIDELIGELDDRVRWVGIGRDSPNDLAWDPPISIEVGPYQRQELVDVVTARADEAFSGNRLDHVHARRISTWADGNAHDALAALFLATQSALEDGRNLIEASDIDDGTAAIQRPSVALLRVFALPNTHQAALRELIQLDDDQRVSVSATTAAITEAPRIDLSTGTVKRVLYEMADNGILERIADTNIQGPGRPPSRLEPRFPPHVFSLLYDRQNR